ncbi:unnamed protein product, partial [Durusdinium trenchii]
HPEAWAYFDRISYFDRDVRRLLQVQEELRGQEDRNRWDVRHLEEDQRALWHDLDRCRQRRRLYPYDTAWTLHEQNVSEKLRSLANYKERLLGHEDRLVQQQQQNQRDFYDLERQLLGLQETMNRSAASAAAVQDLAWSSQPSRTPLLPLYSQTLPTPSLPSTLRAQPTPLPLTSGSRVRTESRDMRTPTHTPKSSTWSSPVRRSPST